MRSCVFVPGELCVSILLDVVSNRGDMDELDMDELDMDELDMDELDMDELDMDELRISSTFTKQKFRRKKKTNRSVSSYSFLKGHIFCLTQVSPHAYTLYIHIYIYI